MNRPYDRIVVITRAAPLLPARVDRAIGRFALFTLVYLAIQLALTACATTVSKLGATAAQVEHDNAECKQQGLIATASYSGNNMLEQGYDMAQIKANCLALKGYR